MLHPKPTTLPAPARRLLLVGAIAAGGFAASIPALPAASAMIAATAAPVAVQSFTAPDAAVAPITRDAFGITSYTVVQWPVPVGTRMSSGFGYRSCNGCDTNHTGIDLNPGNGYPIQVIADGVVTEVGYDSDGAGQYVVVEHDVDGVITSSLYGHMQYGSQAVTVGQAVSRGQELGLVGETGQATGPHLHFEIIVDGVQLNPLPWLIAHANI